MHRKRRRRWLVSAAVLAVALSACGRTVPGATPPPTTAPATTRANPPATSPPTTVFRPKSPQPSPDAAASALVGAWAAGHRAAAAGVASPAAVAALFSRPYPGPGLAIPRGCSSAFPPIVCTYGPPGGASPGDPVFELFLAHAATGWYVASVRPET